MFFVHSEHVDLLIKCQKYVQEVSLVYFHVAMMKYLEQVSPIMMFILHIHLEVRGAWCWCSSALGRTLGVTSSHSRTCVGEQTHLETGLQIQASGSGFYNIEFWFVSSRHSPQNSLLRAVPSLLCHCAGGQAPSILKETNNIWTITEVKQKWVFFPIQEKGKTKLFKGGRVSFF